jgi:hypothetical protein
MRSVLPSPALWSRTSGRFVCLRFVWCGLFRGINAYDVALFCLEILQANGDFILHMAALSGSVEMVLSVPFFALASKLWFG